MRRRTGTSVTVLAALLMGIVVVAASCGSVPTASSKRTPVHDKAASQLPSLPSLRPGSSTTSPAISPTSTTAPPGVATASGEGPVTSPPLPPPAPGFVNGKVTAVGDSVMLDYQQSLQQDIPGVDVEAAVSRQWSDGEALLQQLKAAGQLGAVVVVALGTNGPIASSDVDAMMSILSGASRIVFVTVHVDESWQDPNNGVLAAAASRYPRVVIADWNALAQQNPGWLYSDGTHLPIDGPGAQALAALIASKV